MVPKAIIVAKNRTCVGVKVWGTPASARGTWMHDSYTDALSWYTVGM